MNMSYLDAHVLPRVLHVDSDDDTAVVLATLLVPETEVVHASTLAEAQVHLEHGEFALVVLATLLVPETEVVHAQTLAEARAHLERGEFALVVLDPNLPDGDGQQLVRHLRTLRRHTPVLLYSSTQPTLHHQAQAFLPKPWTSPRQLWHTVAHLLEIDPAVPAALQP